MKTMTYLAFQDLPAKKICI